MNGRLTFYGHVSRMHSARLNTGRMDKSRHRGLDQVTKICRKGLGESDIKDQEHLPNGY